jgi:hypothetical protein
MFWIEVAGGPLDPNNWMKNAPSLILGMADPPTGIRFLLKSRSRWCQRLQTRSRLQPAV